MRTLTADIKIKLSQIMCDNKTDRNGNEHGNNGQFVSKGENAESKKKDSTERAKDIDPREWGTREEIKEKAKLKRTATNFGEAENTLKQIIENSKKDPLKSADGLIANISNKSINKILSGKAVNKSYDLKAHLAAAANADYLFKNSKEMFEPEADKNGNPDLKAIHRTYAPMEWNGAIIPVKFTVKEYTDKNTPNKFYSIEAIDCDLTQKNRECR